MADMKKRRCLKDHKEKKKKIRERIYIYKIYMGLWVWECFGVFRGVDACGGGGG